MKCFHFFILFFSVSGIFAATEPTSKVPTCMQQVAIGGALGTIETVVDHPLFTIKNHGQQLAVQHPELSSRQIIKRMWREYRTNPRALYSGVALNAGSMVPTTALQVGLDQALRGVIPTDTLSQRLVCSALAGVGGAPAANIVELLIVQKQQAERARLLKISVAEVAHDIYKKKGLRGFSRGFSGTAGRELGWAPGFMVLPDILKPYIKHIIDSRSATELAACIAAGSIVGVATHPFDTVKTALQMDIHKQQFSGFSDAVMKLYKSQGIAAFYAQIGARTTRVTSALTIFYCCKGIVTRLVVGEEE